MIKYNKLYLNFLTFTIEHYKEISRKYIIVEKNGKVKEYNNTNNKLIYEGAYSKGKEMEMEREKNILMVVN